jgi:hypothetical protein
MIHMTTQLWWCRGNVQYYQISSPRLLLRKVLENRRAQLASARVEASETSVLSVIFGIMSFASLRPYHMKISVELNPLRIDSIICLIWFLNTAGIIKKKKHSSQV